MTISVPKKIQDKHTGEEKTFWNRVGTLLQFDNGNQIIELSMFPDTKFLVFEDDKKKVEKVEEDIAY